jgi:hypothetical protein
MLSPFMNLLHIGSALHTGDGRMQAWVLAWVAHALTSGAPLFDANMFYPTHASLAHTEHMVALGVLATPIWLATGNAILVFNLLQLLGPALSSFVGFLLFRSWTADWLAGLVGGLAFGFSFFTLLHNAHLNLTWAAGLPLSMLLLERWWRRPTWIYMAALWLVVVFSALTSWYIAVMLGILLVAHATMLIVVSRRVDISRRVPQVIAAALLAVVVLQPFAAPYLGRVAEPGETSAFAADARSYLVPPEHTVVGRWLVNRGLAEPQGIWGERTLFLGWITIGLAGLGLVDLLRSRSRECRGRAWLLMALLVLGVALSFGPSPSGLAPFDWLTRLPGVGGFRAAARFALLVGLACAALVAFGLAWIRRLAPRRAPLVMAGLAALMLSERFVVDFPVGHPRPETMPEVYAFARADGAAAAIALPIYAGQPNWFFETDYLLYSTSADFLPLANGMGRWVPPEYHALGEAMRTFPSPASATALRGYGITHVILHSLRFGDARHDLVAQLRQSMDYAVVAERGGNILLKLRSEDVGRLRPASPN